jgi:hypothetical protein
MQRVKTQMGEITHRVIGYFSYSVNKIFTLKCSYMYNTVKLINEGGKKKSPVSKQQLIFHFQAYKYLISHLKSEKRNSENLYQLLTHICKNKQKRNTGKVNLKEITKYILSKPATY